jgi:hypothetical protein
MQNGPQPALNSLAPECMNHEYGRVDGAQRERLAPARPQRLVARATAMVGA